MIHLIVGSTGAGKTSYALHLQKISKGYIFSIDQWNQKLFLQDKRPEDGLEWMLERIERAEDLILSQIVQLEFIGVDSVLDLGLSKFDHREKFRRFAAEYGFECQLHFLDIPKDIRKQRVLNRNAEKGETYAFDVSQEDFEFMEGYFEAPVG